MKRIFALLSLLCFALLARPIAASAIELSLEENRAQRGSIGYVDMQKIFKLFPETIRARENFDEVVRQAEEQVNLRKAEVIRLRFEIADLKIQREQLAKTLPPAPPVSPSLPPPSVSTAPVSLSTSNFLGITPAPGPVVSAASAPAVSPFALPTSTTPALAALSALPGVSTKPAVLSDYMAPAASAPAISALSAVAVSSPTGPLAELDQKIARRGKDLAAKESDFKQYQAEAEKNLLDLENRRTEILLGKIQKAVKEVARREGVSVVVDKQSILFGHDAVDLTDKVVKELGGKGV